MMGVIKKLKHMQNKIPFESAVSNTHEKAGKKKCLKIHLNVKQIVQ
jgi:hypothetical protein